MKTAQKEDNKVKRKRDQTMGMDRNYRKHSGLT